MARLAIARHTKLSDVPREAGAPPTASLAALTASGGSNEVSAVRQIAPGGEDGPPHKHDCDEIVVVVEGHVDVEAGDETVTLGAGDALLVPADLVHRMRTTHGDAQWLIISRSERRFFAPDGTAIPLPDWAH